MSIAYDPARFMDVKSAEEAVEIILCPTEGMTAEQRWDGETPALMRITERHIKRGSVVLDYGCGIGRLAKPLISQLGCSVVGVDISPNMRALATTLVDSRSFAAIDPEMFGAELVSYVFDAAIAVWSLQHCIDLDDAINNIATSVRRHGKLIVVNNKSRCVPIENGEWDDDGLDVEKMIVEAGFSKVESGRLDESIAPGWMQDGTFWAVFEKR